MTRRIFPPVWAALLALLSVQALDVAWAAPARLSQTLRKVDCCARRCADRDPSLCQRGCCPSTRLPDVGADSTNAPTAATRVAPAASPAPITVALFSSPPPSPPVPVARGAWKPPPSLLHPPLRI